MATRTTRRLSGSEPSGTPTSGPDAAELAAVAADPDNIGDPEGWPDWTDNWHWTPTEEGATGKNASRS